MRFEFDPTGRTISTLVVETYEQYPQVRVVANGVIQNLYHYDGPDPVSGLAALVVDDSVAFTQADFEALLAAHDPGRILASEMAKIVEAGAEDEARQVPDFMGWTPAQAEAWVQANVTDLATAKNVLIKMAMNVAALNARVFPNIRAEQQS